MRPVPVINEPESSVAVFSEGSRETCGVLNENGIFYARLKMQGEDAPWMIALHGIGSESEAHAAFSALAQLPSAECAV